MKIHIFVLEFKCFHMSVFAHLMKIMINRYNFIMQVVSIIAKLCFLESLPLKEEKKWTPSPLLNVVLCNWFCCCYCFVFKMSFITTFFCSVDSGKKGLITKNSPNHHQIVINQEEGMTSIAFPGTCLWSFLCLHEFHMDFPIQCDIRSV